MTRLIQLFIVIVCISLLNQHIPLSIGNKYHWPRLTSRHTIMVEDASIAFVLQKHSPFDL
jgi:hypothetical protein